jgi:CheY-like chemotaxis protein
MKSHALARSFTPPIPDQAPARRILLAEDNDTMRRLLAFVLRSEGHQIVEARDSTELLEALAATLMEPSAPPFDVVISEQSLPGITGLSILTGLRTRDRTTPFVLITADPDVQNQARHLGAVILDQPFNIQAIRSAVRPA